MRSISTFFNILRNLFACFGLPNRTTVSDNERAFTSKEFRKFLKRNSVDHVTRTPLHPSSNIAAQDWMKTIRHVFKKNHKKIL